MTVMKKKECTSGMLLIVTVINKSFDHGRQNTTLLLTIAIEEISPLMLDCLPSCAFPC